MTVYQRSLLCSILFHIGIIFLAVVFTFSSRHPLSQVTESAPVQAMAVDESKVVTAVKQIQQERTSARVAEQKKLAAVKNELNLANKKRRQEKQQLAQLHKQALAKEQLLQAEDRKIKQAKRKTEQELKHLAEQKNLAIKEQARLKQRISDLRNKAKTIPHQRPTSSAKTSEQLTAINHYKAMIVQAIAEYWVVPQHIEGHPTCVVHARLAPDGSVLEVSVVKNSGNDALDRSAVAAVYKASPLPIPKDTVLFDTFRELQLTVRPEGIIKV